MSAPTRRTHPPTSFDAAASIDPDTLTTVRKRVLALLQLRPEGITHDQLIAGYRRFAVLYGWPNASDSSIRTRCSELVRDGDVEAIPDSLGRTRSGRATLIWRVVEGVE